MASLAVLFPEAVVDVLTGLALPVTVSLLEPRGALGVFLTSPAGSSAPSEFTLASLGLPLLSNLRMLILFLRFCWVFEHMLGLAVQIFVILRLMTPIALRPPLEVIVLAGGADPAAVWELIFIVHLDRLGVLSNFLLFGLHLFILRLFLHYFRLGIEWLRIMRN